MFKLFDPRDLDELLRTSSYKLSSDHTFKEMVKAK
jgi:hypothetical protein